VSDRKDNGRIGEKAVRMLTHPCFAASLPGVVMRRFLRGVDKRTALFSPHFVTALNATERPPYAYCLYNAAVLARKLGLDAMSVIEFGVAGGNGLVFLDNFAKRVENALNLRIEVYGFDTGEGLSAPVGHEDMPYWYRGSLYRMDVDSLKSRLSTAQLVLGDVRQTVSHFFAEHHAAPVGAMFNDLDLYSSTAGSLRIFDNAPGHFLPRVFMYFDDVIGTETAMFGDCNGELRAIADFNRSHDNIQIVPNRNILPRYDLNYRHKVFYAHLFSHPLYSRYIGEDEQQRFEVTLSLNNW